MIPGRDKNSALNFFRTQQLDGELRIFTRRRGFAFDLNGGCWNTGLQQKLPVNFVIALPADDEARGRVKLE